LVKSNNKKQTKQNKTIKQKQNENFNEDFTTQLYTQEYDMLIFLLKNKEM